MAKFVAVNLFPGTVQGIHGVNTLLLFTDISEHIRFYFLAFGSMR